MERLSFLQTKSAGNGTTSDPLPSESQLVPIALSRMICLGVLMTGLSWSRTTPRTMHQFSDAQTGKPVHTLRGHTEECVAVEWHPGQNVIYSASEDQTVRIWNPLSGKCMATSRSLGKPISNLAWDRSGKRLAVSLSEGMETSLMILESSPDLPIDEWPRNELPTVNGLKPNRQLDWSPAGNQIAGCMAQGYFDQEQKIAIWDIDSETIVKQPTEGDLCPLERRWQSDFSLPHM